MYSRIIRDLFPYKTTAEGEGTGYLHEVWISEVSLYVQRYAHAV